MVWKLEFTKIAIKQLKKIKWNDYRRLQEKIKRFMKQDNPLQYARKLVNHPLWEWRRRIGEFRVVFDVDEYWKIIIIQVIWNRKDIYTQ